MFDDLLKRLFGKGGKAGFPDPTPYLFPMAIAVCSILVFGSVGSGKTTSAYRIANYLMLTETGISAFGVPNAFLFTTVKPTDAEGIRRLCEMSGRLGSMFRITPDGPYRINLLHYMLTMEGGGSRQVANTLLRLDELEGGRDGERFWRNIVYRLFYYGSKLLHLTGDPDLMNFSRLNQVITTIPRPGHGKEGSFCHRLMTTVGATELTPEQREDHADIVDFFSEMTALADKTLSGAVSSATGILQPFLEQPFKRLFGTDTTVTPELILDHSLICVLDFDILTYGQGAKFGQSVFKSIMQQACLRRDIKKLPAALCCVCDEFHAISHLAEEAKVLSLSRSQRYFGINLTQNLPGLIACATGETPEKSVLMLIANHGSKIAFANSDASTNELMSQICGQTLQTSFGGSSGPMPNVVDSLLGQAKPPSMNWNQQYRVQLQPAVMTGLKRGGKPDFLAEAIVIQDGNPFNGKPFIRVFFEQVI